MKRLAFPAAAVLALVVHGPLIADNWDQPFTTINDSSFLTTTNELVHGSVQIHDLDATNSGLSEDEDWYFLSFKPYSSYEVVVDGTTPYMNRFTSVSLDLVLNDGTVVLPSVPTSSKAFSRSLRFANAAATPADNLWFRVFALDCSGACTDVDTYQIRAYDTTYRVARFNNSASQITILIVQNPTDSAVVTQVSFFNAAGALLNQAFTTIPPFGIYSVNTATLAPGAGGSISITHDAPYGALSGKAVAVEPATGFTFDTAMLPRVN